VELLSGIHPVREALRARRRRLLRLRLRAPLSKEGAALAALAEGAGAPVEQLAAADFEAASAGRRSQGALLEAGPLPPLGVDELAAAGAPGGRCLVALDGVEDPQNVGAIARAADAAGASGLLLTSRRAPPLSAAVCRASAGAIEHLPVGRAPNLVRALEALQRGGFWCLGADAGAGEALFESPDRAWQGDLVIVLGAEGRGLRPGTLRRLDWRLRIPVAGGVESLNVAAAAAVVLYERLRRRALAAGAAKS